MIHVTRLNRTTVVVNSDLIEFIENTPDTVITMLNDRKMTVLETAEDVVEKIRTWRRSLRLDADSTLKDPAETGRIAFRGEKH
jgi:flagellar protein FlbD